MPLAGQAFLAYAAGLLVGFEGHAAPTTLIAASALVLLWWRGRRDQAVLALLLGAGGLAARDAELRDAQCEARLRSNGRAVVRLLTPLEPRRTAKGEIASGGCRLTVRLRGDGRSLPAGTRVHVDGQVLRRARGVEIQARALREVGAPSVVATWRAVIGRRIDALFGSDAPLARALLLADANDLDRALRDRYADAGIVHMLSVSGLHVAIIANAVRGIIVAGGGAVSVGEGGSLLVTLLFVAFIGAPPPAVRSAVMLAAVAASRRLQRPTSVWAIWGSSCAASLVEPRVVLDLGWQLSVTGMAGLLASAGLVRRLAAGLRGVQRTIVEGMIATTVASLATAPLIAWTFGRLSLAAIVTNPAASPLFSLAQPLLFATLVALPIEPLARLLADASRSALWAIDLVARGGASLPFAAVSVQPDLVTTTLLAVAAGALLVTLVGRWPRRPMLVALGALALAAWWPRIAPGPGRLELHVLDVGQGDAIALRTPRGRWILVDAGGVWPGGDAAASVVLPYLRRYGGPIALLAMSHPHADHVGGAARIVRSGAGAGAVWDGGYVDASTPYRDVLAAVQERGTPWRRARAGDSASIDGVTLRVLAPDSAWLAALDNPNEASLVVKVSLGRVSFLLTGDAESGEEEWLVGRYGEALRADVLKVGHHGSATSSSAAFLDAVAPRLALVSVGAGNRYGHPSRDVVERIAARGAQLLRTDHEGTIVVSTDGRVIEVKSHEATWRFSSGR